MNKVLLAGVLAALPAVAFAQPAAGDDLSRGVELRRQGHAREAVPLLEAAVRAHPADADAWLNLGLAYSAASRLPQAQEALDRALALAPDYLDAQIARARVAYFEGELAEARRRAGAIAAAHPDNREAAELVAQVAAAEAEAPPPWRLDATYTYGALSKGLPPAWSAVASATRSLADHRSLGLSIDETRQFGETDTYAEATLGGRLGYLAAGGAPNAHFRPQWAVRGGLAGASLAAGPWRLAPLVDLAWARYPVGDVRSATPALELSRGEAVAVDLRWFNVLDETNRYRAGVGVGGRWRVARPLQLSAGYADAPETDAGRTMRVRTVSVGAAWDLAAGLTLRLGADREARKAYDRTDLTVGLTRRF